MGRPKNRFGLSPLALESALRSSKKQPATFNSEVPTIAYVIENVQRPYAYELCPSAHPMYWWARIIQESGVSWAFPALVRDDDLTALQELWEIDEALWVDMKSVPEYGFPSDWTVPHAFATDGMHHMAWDYQRTPEGQRVCLRREKFPHRTRTQVPFGGLFGTKLSDWVPSIANFDPIHELNEWGPSMRVGGFEALYSASANFFRRVVIQNRWVPHARELGISDENAVIPLEARSR